MTQKDHLQKKTPRFKKTSLFSSFKVSLLIIKRELELMPNSRCRHREWTLTKLTFKHNSLLQYIRSKIRGDVTSCGSTSGSYTHALYGTCACRPSTLTHFPRCREHRWSTSMYLAGRKCTMNMTNALTHMRHTCWPTHQMS